MPDPCIAENDEFDAMLDMLFSDDLAAKGSCVSACLPHTGLQLCGAVEA